MIKGISRQIIELVDNQNPYFERAWLLVRVESAEKPPEQLKEAGERLLRHAKPHTGLVQNCRRFRLKMGGALLLAAALGTALGYILSL